MSDVIVWADIPVMDIRRAMKFYGAVTQQPVILLPGSDDVAVIGAPAAGEESRVSADLYVGGTPSYTGATVYLDSNGDIDGMLGRVEPAGGKILEDKQDMGEMIGWIAFVADTEGNRVGIQQPHDSI